MTGGWLASYILLWILMLAVCLLLIGVLQQLGRINQQLRSVVKEGEATTAPGPEDDGPLLASALPDLVVETFNDFGTVSLSDWSGKEAVVIVFLSPLCESCQAIVEPLNTLARADEHHLKIIVIMRSDAQACRAFLSLFPLHLPVVCDSSREITRSFNVHSTPFGLFYDAQGALRRRGLVRGEDELVALLKDQDMSHHTLSREISSNS
jgi:methylamine dehydrogenase accessory protein MauD